MNLTVPFKDHIIYHHHLKEVFLHCRYLRSDGSEFTGDVIAVSNELVVIEGGTKVLPGQGENVILYIDQLGRMEGRSSLIDMGMRLIHLNVNDRQKQRLASKIESLDETGKIAGEIEKPVKNNKLILSDGSVHDCVVSGVSLWGMFITTTANPSIDERVQVGNLVGFVNRKDKDGIRVAFRHNKPQNAMSRHFPRL